MMVAITYQTVLSTLQTAGLLVGIFYYVTTLRNAQKTRELALKNQELTLQSQELTRKAQDQALETRRVQLHMQLYQEMGTTENLRIFNELINMDWEDWDDFIRKYGPDENPENWVSRYSMWNRLNGVGLLLKGGHIDVGMAHDLMRTTVLMQWEKWRDIIFRTRVEYNMPGARAQLSTLFSRVFASSLHMALV